MAARRGGPLAARSTPADVNAGPVLARLVDASPPPSPPLTPPRGRRGRPRQRPKKLHAEKGYAARTNRARLRRRHSTPRIARPTGDSRETLGRHRWGAARAVAWLHANRRRRTRSERSPDRPDAFRDLGCALVCWQFIERDALCEDLLAVVC